jgi:hypothetical protein
MREGADHGAARNWAAAMSTSCHQVRRLMLLRSSILDIQEEEDEQKPSTIGVLFIEKMIQFDAFIEGHIYALPWKPGRFNSTRKPQHTQNLEMNSPT